MSRIRRYRLWNSDNWPENWQLLWHAANEQGDVFKEPGRAHRRVARSRTSAEWAFGRYYQFLKERGRWDDNTFLDQFNLRDYAIHLRLTVAPMTVVNQLKELLAAVQIMRPDLNVQDAWSAVQRYETAALPVRDVADRLIDPVELIAQGSEIMAEADLVKEPDARTAMHHGMGALIVAATYCPLRLRNWQNMIIDRHVDLQSGRVHFEAGELKRKNAGIEFTMPPEALAGLRRFAQYRPMLMRPDAKDQGYLWPAGDGGPLHRNTLGTAVKRLLLRRTGKPFNFHCFRHSCATFIADVAPERARMASSILHHSRRSTTEKHYVKARKRMAFRRYQEAVRAVVAKGRRRARRNRGLK